MDTTRHTCGGPAFGRRTPGCPRCDELAAGAAPVRWAGAARADRERRDAEALRAHRATCTDRVCTFGDW